MLPHQNLLLRRTVPAVVAGLTFGCSDSATEPRVGPPTEIIPISGDGQVRQAGSELPAPLVVTVRDSYDKPVPGVDVAFSTGDGGSLTPPMAETDSAGRARAHWRLGPAAGPQTVRASVGSVQISFSATAVDVALSLVGELGNRRYLTADTIAVAVIIEGHAELPDDSIRWATTTGTLG